jgi:hypothetical protein
MGGFASTQDYGTVDDSEMGGFASNQNFGSVDDSEMGGFATVAPPKPTAPLDLNALNLPGFSSQIKANAASVPAAVNKPAERQPSPGKKINPETGEEYSPVAEMKPKVAAASKSATLDDVVKSLDMLNKQMGLLISQQDNLMRKQERNMKSASSTNVQDKV